MEYSSEELCRDLGAAICEERLGCAVFQNPVLCKLHHYAVLGDTTEGYDMDEFSEPVRYEEDEPEPYLNLGYGLRMSAKTDSRGNA